MLLSSFSCHVFSFFFFKQKTAYEMRISDWSSDVCSSDLTDTAAATLAARPAAQAARWPAFDWADPLGLDASLTDEERMIRDSARAFCDTELRPVVRAANRSERSEEHTYELQSLMRISYAVFCLKKKTRTVDLAHTNNI